MKKLKLLFLLIFLVNLSLLKAQNVDIKMGELIEGSDRFINNQFLPMGTDSEGNSYLFFYAKNKNTKVFKYNKENVLLKEKTLDISFMKFVGYFSQFEDFFIINDKAYIIQSSLNTKDKTSTVYAHELDLNTLVLNPVGKKLCSKKVEGKLGLIPVNIYLSPDSSRFLIKFTSSTFHGSLLSLNFKNTTNEPFYTDYEAVVLDNSFDFISEFKESFSFTGVAFTHDASLFLNSGEVFSLGKLISQNGKDAEINVKTTLLHLELGKITKKVEFELSGGNQPIITRFAPDQDEKYLTILGFYSGRNPNEGFKGTFYLKIEKSTLKIVSEKLNPFSEKLFAFFERIQLRENEERYILKFLYDKPIFLTEDGSMYLFGEEINRSTSSSSLSVNIYDEYYAQNILMFKYDKNGELTNQNVIERKYDGLRMSECTFSAIYNPDDDKFYFLYMNFASEKDEHRFFVCSKVDMNLNIESEQQIFDSKIDGNIYLASDYMMTSNNSMIGFFDTTKKGIQRKFGFFKFK